MRLFNKALPAVVIAAGSLYLSAQEGSAPTFRADTRLVVLHASVADKAGRLLTALKRESFKVYENGVEQQIKEFKREDVPVSLGIVVDNSGSMRGKRKKVEAAALAAVKASNPGDEVTIINFNDEAFQDTTFTSDIKKMEEALTRIDSRGGTAMRDAISGTIDYVKAKGKHQKKVILVITDGADTASTPDMTLERLVGKAHQSEVLLYLIGILNEEEKREAKKAKRALQTLASASGGSAVFPEDLVSIEKVALAIANEIRNQYIITYTPTNQSLDGTFRTVKIAVDAPGKPVARTRSGYYATPEKPQPKQSASRTEQREQ